MSEQSKRNHLRSVERSRLHLGADDLPYWELSNGAHEQRCRFVMAEYDRMDRDNKRLMAMRVRGLD